MVMNLLQIILKAGELEQGSLGSAGTQEIL